MKQNDSKLVGNKVPGKNRVSATVKKAADDMAVVMSIDVNRIKPSPYNPRKSFNDAETNELAESMKVIGLIQPIVVREKADVYEIVCGERRWRAAQKAGLNAVPAYVKVIDDEQAEITAIVENVQRVDVSAIEQAEAYDRLFQKGMDVDNIALLTGKSKAFIAQRRNLLKLIPEVVELLDDITLGNALELAKYKEEIQKEIYEEYLQDDSLDSWRKIKTSDFSKNMMEIYMTSLNEYHFDKNQCEKCTENTANQLLFSNMSDCPTCGNCDCLAEKNHRFIVEKVIRLKGENASRSIKNRYADPAVVKKLKSLDYEISEYGWAKDYAVIKKPEVPIRKDFKTDTDFEEALIEYESDSKDYVTMMEKMQEKLVTGEYLENIVIDRLDVEIQYTKQAKIEEDVNDEDIIEVVDENTGEITEVSISESLKLPQRPVTTIEEAERRKRFKTAGNDNARYFQKCSEDVLNDIKKIRLDFPKTTLSPIEEKMFYFSLLDNYMDTGLTRQLGIEDPKSLLSDDDKLRIINGLTSERKNLILRYHLHKALGMKAIRVNLASQMLRTFIRIYRQTEHDKIEQKHYNIYLKRYDECCKTLGNEEPANELEKFEFNGYEEDESPFVDVIEIESEEFNGEESKTRVLENFMEYPPEEEIEPNIELPEEGEPAKEDSPYIVPDGDDEPSDYPKLPDDTESKQTKKGRPKKAA